MYLVLVFFSAGDGNLVTSHCSFCISSFSALCSDFEIKCPRLDCQLTVLRKSQLQPLIVNMAKVSDLHSLCFQLCFKLGDICVPWLCKYLIQSPEFWPSAEGGLEMLCAVSSDLH